MANTNRSILKRNQVLVIIFLTLLSLSLLKYIANIYYPTTDEVSRANQKQSGFEKSLDLIDTDEFMVDLKEKLLKEKKSQILQQVKQDVFREESWKLVNQLKNEMRDNLRESLMEEARRKAELRVILENRPGLRDASQFLNFHSNILSILQERYRPSISNMTEISVSIDPLPYYNISTSSAYTLDHLSSLIDFKSEDLLDLSKTHKQIIKFIKDFNFDKNLYNGDGIVIVNQDFLSSLVIIRHLRDLESTLPIEVMISNDESFDGHICDKVFPTFNATCINILNFSPTEVKVSKHEVLSLFLSRFENIILINGDNVPLKNPDSLIKSKPFKSTSCILWPSLYQRTTNPQYYDIANILIGEPVKKDSLGLKSEWGYRSETAVYDLENALPINTIDLNQLVISKKTHFEAILLALYYEFNWDVYGKLFSQNLLRKDHFRSGESLIAGLHFFKEDYYISSTKDFGSYTKGFISQVDPDEDWKNSNEIYKYKMINNIDTRTNLDTNDPSTTQLKAKILQYLSTKEIQRPTPLFMRLSNYTHKANPFSMFPRVNEQYNGALKHQIDSYEIDTIYNMDYELRLFSIGKWVSCELETGDDIWINNQRDKNQVCGFLKEKVNFLVEVSEYDDSQIASLNVDG